MSELGLGCPVQVYPSETVNLDSFFALIGLFAVF